MWRELNRGAQRATRDYTGCYKAAQRKSSYFSFVWKQTLSSRTTFSLTAQFYQAQPPLPTPFYEWWPKFQNNGPENRQKVTGQNSKQSPRSRRYPFGTRFECEVQRVYLAGTLERRFTNVYLIRSWFIIPSKSGGGRGIGWQGSFVLLKCQGGETAVRAGICSISRTAAEFSRLEQGAWCSRIRVHPLD